MKEISMCRYRIWMAFAAAGCAGLLVGASPAGAAAPAPGRPVVAVASTGPPDGTWGQAELIPGLAGLNVGGIARISSLSCPSAGNCSAGGFYRDGSGKFQLFVVSERTDVWGRAMEIPGLAALNFGGDARVSAVSCGSPGNCVAGGWYSGADNGYQAFVVSQQHGRWGKALEVPGTKALNAGGSAAITSVSCPPAGGCTGGGYYTSRTGRVQALIVRQRNGTWGRAQPVPGLAALNVGGDAEIASVSCPSAGNCGAAGDYTDRSHQHYTYVVSERNGTWGRAQRVPGLRKLDTGGNDAITSLSCPSPRNCDAGGSYETRVSNEAFVVSERNGTWGQAHPVPGLAALNAGGDATINSVSCSSRGNCGAGGFYQEGPYQEGPHQAFLVSERNGTWGKAQQVPGTAALNTKGFAQITSVSCPSAGNCGAGGTYADLTHQTQLFVVTQQNGKWGTAIQIPGTAALNTNGFAGLESMSCPSAGHCVAAGYLDQTGRVLAFVVSQT